MTIRTPTTVAIAGTAGICAAAFILSFAALCDLAARSGVTTPWLWPAIVDGLIVVATVAVVAGAGRYAWCLLAAGALVSVVGNVLHAAVPDGALPVWLRAAVAAVPPVALVAVAHLAVVLRRNGAAADPVSTPDVPAACEETSVEPDPGAATADDVAQSRDVALRLLREGMHPNEIAERFGVHRTTVYRWRRGAKVPA